LTKEDRGQFANSPWQMPLTGWKEIAARVWRQTWIDNVGLVAAGVAFYGFLAVVPLLGLLALVYGFIADPSTVVQNLSSLTSILPADVAALIGQLLVAAVKSSKTTKGVGVVVALVFSLYGGCNSAGAIITALNIAYQEREKRSLTRFYLLALTMTLVAVAMGIVALFVTTVVTRLSDLFPQAAPLAIISSKLAAYVVLTLVGAGIAALLFRVAPSRQDARWKWVTPGSMFTGVAWLLFTLLFSFYATRVTNYSVTYGPLGTMIALLTWIYLSAYVLIMGAELNNETEYQTSKDSTTGAPEPMGRRGAWAADHVASDADPEEQIEDRQEAPSLGAAGPPVPTDDQKSG
jgi:membrane protein